MSTTEADNDTSVIDLNATDETANTNEDRGDVVSTSPSATAVQTPEKTETNAQAAADTAAADDVHKHGIPKARFDEVNERRKQAENELEQTRDELARIKQAAAHPANTASATDTAQAGQTGKTVDEQEAEYIEAMMEGNTDRALEIRRSINAQLVVEAETRVETRNNQITAASQLQAESDKAVADYPYLDTDEGAVALGLIIDARNANVARGMPVVEALREAVKTIAPRFAPAADPTRVLQTTAKQVDTRSADALRRGAADSIKQPPPIVAGVGNRATSAMPNINEMTEEQFDNLSEAEKKRARGDY